MEATPQSQLRPERPDFSAAQAEAAKVESRGLRARLSVRETASALLALAAGLWLRLWMQGNFFQVNGDSLIYGGLARNLLLHGRFALAGAGSEIYPTLIRLPGYPLFVALCWRIFGMENYAAVAWVQIALELAGCLLLADFARRIAADPWKRGVAQTTLWLAALCPFTAIYAAQPLTEAPTLFTLALALNAAARFRERPRWGSALAFTFAVTWAALLRPDGALVGIALAPAMAMGLFPRRLNTGRPTQAENGCPTLAASLFLRPGWAAATQFSPLGLSPSESTENDNAPETTSFKKPVRMALTCLLLALTPFALWTARNWHVFHVFQPLAPRYASDPGEDTWPGWQRWTKTWCLDFVSTYDIYWNVPGAPLDLTKLPARAFDSPAQYAETRALAADYEAGGEVFTHAIDKRFAKLAEDRVRAHPLRYYVVLPLGRLADMTLRPRVENLPIDLDWWAYARHMAETRFSWFYTALNALYLLLALGGFCLRPRLWPWMALYLALRGVLLMTIEAPEARYTLEYFPMIFALAGVFAGWALARARGAFALASHRRCQPTEDEPRPGAPSLRREQGPSGP